jgi:HEAT repeat protein
MQVMQQLVNAGAPEGMRLAEEMLGSKDPGAGSQAVWALAGQGTDEARRLIERAIDSKDPATRMAAISSLMQNPDDRSTDTLLRLSRDSDPGVRATALTTLGQIGSERAQTAILDATRYGKTEDRVAAISGLANMDDPRASQQLASLMRDRDPQVAMTAIQSSYNGGAEVDDALTRLVNDPSSADNMKAIAAQQLRNRGTDLDDSTEAAVTKLAGAANLYGGYGYGGYAARDYVE